MSCSPRTRGWTPLEGRLVQPDELLPAHAGMDPSRTGQAHAPTPAPRARGDGPNSGPTGDHGTICSPRTRGWTRAQVRRPGVEPLLPAHAGMDPPAGPV
ncbi:hypothetical protein Q7689_36415, partial [Nocardiopsis tropica]|nr:hypothetical protein [Nocardiopsis tropica]